MGGGVGRWEIETRPVRPLSSSGAGGWMGVGMGTDVTRVENGRYVQTGSGPCSPLNMVLNVHRNRTAY